VETPVPADPRRATAPGYAHQAAWRAAAIVLASVAVAAASRIALDPILHERAVFLLFVIAVALSAHLAGFWAGLATAVLSVAAAVALQLFAPAGVGLHDSVQVSLFLLTAIPISLLGGSLRNSLERERRLLKSESAARAALERTSRLKDEFLAVLSHELRSPLNTVVGWAHILKGTALPADAVHAVEIILRSADQQVKLLSEIADLSRIATGKLVLEDGLVDVRGILDQAVDAIRLAADVRGIKLQLVIPEMPLIVRGDAGRLQQVLWNLLSNAIKFSSAGASVQASAGLKARMVTVEVTDTGQGIHPEFLPHVFESFRQEDQSTARVHGGLGLGLAIVKHLTEAHGGSVHADSDGPGKGSRFTVALPAFAGVADAVTPSEVARPQLTGLRILVVDDDPDARELVARALGDLGGQVVTTSSAAEARAELDLRKPDVIVSDIGMPGEDGLSFIRALRGHPAHRDIPAIALTAYATATDQAEAIKAGYREHVPKPVQPYRLARVIMMALQRPS
jgi:signal transduction histidine kinase/ActR/RegA family two-component response regulator